MTRLVVVEDNAACSDRQSSARNGAGSRIRVQLHRINRSGARTVGVRSYQAGALAQPSGKARLALALLDSAQIGPRTLIAAGSTFGCNKAFVDALLQRGSSFLVEIRPSTNVTVIGGRGRAAAAASALLERARWRAHEFTPPGGEPMACLIADLARVVLGEGVRGRLVAVQIGAIEGIHRGTVFAITNATAESLAQLLSPVVWLRWIRRVLRRRPTVSNTPKKTKRNKQVNGAILRVRSNITLARAQDERAYWSARSRLQGNAQPRLLPATANVVELFAGAGGMGLGFLLATHRSRRYRLTCSAEIHPIYVATLKKNHERLLQLGGFDETHLPPDTAPIDLARHDAAAILGESARSRGDVDVLIGGPPCQGFSNANRNSWSGSNPNNRLVDVFFSYVELFRPRVFVMENVQGVLWTEKGSDGSRANIIDHVAARIRRAGYHVFPKLLDAVWYGVPQYRSRFFLLGIHRDCGVLPDDFGDWGPFPVPTHGGKSGRGLVTVRQALADLPEIGNGQLIADLRYDEQRRATMPADSFLRWLRTHAGRNRISDHITSRHADYVIERYRRIPPGGNWEDIKDSLTNYANVGRTHSNIYRRLTWDDPSITIGHYRKAMLVHPEQDRGLSLREASRLQSFPDWFRFQGSTDGRPGGLVHKQQQLANAVCPLVTKALAEHLLSI